MSNEFPVYRGSTTGLPPSKGGMTLGKAILGVVVGFVLLIVVGFKIIDCRRTNEYGTGGVTCDQAGPRMRQEWIDAPNKLRDDLASPSQLGLRAEGQCLSKIVGRQISCDESTVVSIERDNPYLREALARGFTTYVCETLENGKQVQREFPLRKVVGR